MFKTVLRALALACMFALSVALIVLAFFPNLAPPWVHVAIFLAVLVYTMRSAWRALRPASQRKFARWFIAITLGGGMLASLSACAGLPLTGNPAADAKAAASNFGSVNGSLALVNQQLMAQIIQVCGFDVDFNVAIPSPIPTGSLKIKCSIQPGALSPAPAVQAAAAAGVASDSFAPAPAKP